MLANYYHGLDLSTQIRVNYQNRTVSIINYTANPIDRAFGVNPTPTIEDWEAFLESRCFPRTRDKMKWHLKELGLDCYDPLQIVKKTKGKMAEDTMWLEIIEETLCKNMLL